MVGIAIGKTLRLTSTPRLSTCLVSGLLAHGVWLSLVLCHAGMCVSIVSSAAVLSNSSLIHHVLDNVRANRCLEDIWEGESVFRWAIGTVDGDSWSACHFDCHELSALHDRLIKSVNNFDRQVKMDSSRGLM